ncbi:hypothetical protein BN2537_15053 [Streptomyces venezuelae]|nr:hypothetical protein BN2537_15053 [Streptomyces venezuelae]
MVSSVDAFLYSVHEPGAGVVQYRRSAFSRPPGHPAELVDVVAGSPAEQVGDLFLVAAQGVYGEVGGVACGAVGAVGGGDPHHETGRLDRAW